MRAPGKAVLDKVKQTAKRHLIHVRPQPWTPDSKKILHRLPVIEMLLPAFDLDIFQIGIDGIGSIGNPQANSAHIMISRLVCSGAAPSWEAMECKNCRSPKCEREM